MSVTGSWTAEGEGQVEREVVKSAEASGLGFRNKCFDRVVHDANDTFAKRCLENTACAFRAPWSRAVPAVPDC